MQLSGSQVKQIHAALLDGYSPDTLRMLVRIELGESLEAIAGPGPLSTVAFSLIGWAERTGRVQDLIDGALAQQPGNARVRALHEQSKGWGLAAGSAPAAATPDGAGAVFDQRDQQVETQTNVAGDLVHGDKAAGDKVVGDKYIAEHITIIQGGAADARAVQDAPPPNILAVDFDWATVPAGEFLYGDDKRPIYLDAFQISRTPVTNRQYQAFVEATGYVHPEHWGGRRVHPTLMSHPVVNVGWGDVHAFCEWAGVFLPTEQQWEKAARGTDGRDYPWGDQPPSAELCNFDNQVSATTPVGRYSPRGDSPYGLVDVAGNVWEWCEDWYDSDRTVRVVRGGSFWNAAGAVRCACRGQYNPRQQARLGFRVIASPGS